MAKQLQPGPVDLDLNIQKMRMQAMENLFGAIQKVAKELNDALRPFQDIDALERLMNNQHSGSVLSRLAEQAGVYDAPAKGKVGRPRKEQPPERRGRIKITSAERDKLADSVRFVLAKHADGIDTEQMRLLLLDSKTIPSHWRDDRARAMIIKVAKSIRGIKIQQRYGPGMTSILRPTQSLIDSAGNVGQREGADSEDGAPPPAPGDERLQKAVQKYNPSLPTRPQMRDFFTKAFIELGSKKPLVISDLIAVARFNGWPDKVNGDKLSNMVARTLRLLADDHVLRRHGPTGAAARLKRGSVSYTLVRPTLSITKSE